MKARIFQFVVLALVGGVSVAAQTVDDTQLKFVILFGRHGVRTPNSPNSVLNNFAVQPFPVFPDVPGNPSDNTPSILTPNGAASETLLGGYFRLWLTQEGLLTGNDAADAANVYFHADAAPLIINTAQAFAAGLLPSAAVTVNSVSKPPDPQAIGSAYSAELALIRSVLFNYPINQTPAPATPAGKMDVTSIPITVGTGNSQLPVNLGGLATIALAIDPFVMEYADGLPASEVAWGQFTESQISQVFRVYDRLLDLEFRTPYMASVQTSNLASHTVRSLVQAATGNPVAGTLTSPSAKIVSLTASNFNIAGLAGLFHLDWLLPGYQPDVAAPGGVLMFQLRQSQTTGEYVVRVTYVSQTMDQLRNQTALTLAAPPPSAPVAIPGCASEDANLDCPLGRFVRIANELIDSQAADLVQ